MESQRTIKRKKSHPGHIEVRNGAYCLRLSVGGRRYTKTIPASSYKEARTIAKRTYDDLKQRYERTQREHLQEKSISKLLSEYEQLALPLLKPGTVRSYRDSLKPIRTYFTRHTSIRVVQDVTEKHVEDYLAWRRNNRGDRTTEPLSNRTLQKDRTVLHTVFRFAKRRKYCSVNPVVDTDRPKCDEFDPVILTDSEYERLLAECSHSPMLYLYVLLLGETGLRCNSEALHLQWADLLFEMHDFGCLKIVSGRDGHTTKSGRSRYVPITTKLHPVLKEHMRKYRDVEYVNGKSPYVFHHLSSHVKFTAGERIKSLYGGFKNAAERAKLPKNLRQHDLRHFRATQWLAAGYSPAVVQQAMGHSDIKTTIGYYRFLPEHLRVLTDRALTHPQNN